VPFPDTLLVARRLSTPAMARRGLVFSTVVLIERLLVPAAAWAFFGRALPEKMALLFAAAAAFSGRTYAQHAFRAQTEVDLFERVVTCVIEGDVLRNNVLRDEDARAELGQAVYHAAQSVSVVVPVLIADAVAAVPLTVFIVAGEPRRLAGMAIGMALAAALVLLATRRSMEETLTSVWSAQQEAFAGFMDALEGRLDVVASGRRAAFLSLMHVRARAWAVAGTRVAAGALVSGKVPLLAIASAVAVGVAVVGGRGRSALGVTTADVALLASMAPVFSGIAQGLFALARAERWMGVVASALSVPPTKEGGARAPPRLPAPIAFEEVSFCYEGRSVDALREVSFVWEPERVIVFTGANGSGKSTCLRLLLALAEPRAGSITVGGVRLDEFDADAWRAAAAFLPQRPYLPSRSDVRGAMRFLAPDATDQSMRQALERVGLLGSLKRAGEDPLGVRIDALSVGERQRIGLARLLCQRSSLVLLDEPDANLDRAGIALVAKLVHEISREAMVALVAHSPELLEVADRVIVLDEGRLIRDDSRDRSEAQRGLPRTGDRQSRK
jgi:ABC-type bacteriocin/lantibiotic exporter with double-glycine peptidase domain